MYCTNILSDDAIMETIIICVNKFILIYFIILSGLYLMLLFGAIPDIFHRFRENKIGKIFSIVKTNSTIPLSMIIPTYNAEKTILDCIESVLKSDYANIKIIIVNDGSTDNTFNLLNEKFKFSRVPIILNQKVKTKPVNKLFVSEVNAHIVYIEKENGGTGDALNVGFNAVETPFFCTLDADTIIEKDAISKLMYSILSISHSVIVGGAVYILNDCDYRDGEMLNLRISNNPVVALQVCEYLRSFLFGRSGWNAYNGSISYAGALTLFETKAVVDVGGFDINNPAQDAEIIAKVHHYMIEHKYPYRISFNPSAFAYTEVPSNLVSYWKQRVKWQWGLLRSYFKHINMLFNPKYKLIGFFTYPFFLLVEALGPIVEFSAYLFFILGIAFSVVQPIYGLLFILVAFGFVLFLTMANFLISIVTFNRFHRPSDLIKMFFLVMLETFGFRQYYTVARVYGTLVYFYKLMRRKF